MKKKILALCLVVVLAATAVIGGTLAYFTDTEEATNTFTIGNIDITLDEEKPGADGERTDGGIAYENVMPGVAYAKDPVVTNIGDNDAYVRVKVTVQNGATWLELFGEETVEENFAALINNTLGDDWEIAEVEAVEGDIVATLNYTELLPAGEAAPAVFTEVMIPAALEDVTIISEDGGFSIDVVAEAIQAESFTGYAEALAALDA